MTLLTGCLGAPSQRIEVTRSNTFGIRWLSSEHESAGTSEVYKLRAYADASDLPVASVTMTVGDIPDLVNALPGDESRGSEILIAVLDGSRQIRSHETNPGLYANLLGSPFKEFLALDAIRATLAQDAGLQVVVAQDPADERAYAHMGLWNCLANEILVSPTAQQCCSDSWGTNFFRGSDQNLILRWRNPNNAVGCKASDGVSACSGSDCYFGPFGYARAIAVAGNGPYPVMYDDDTGYCNGEWDYSPYYPTGIPTFPDANGTNPLNQGCPGGTTGAGQWDY